MTPDRSRDSSLSAALAPLVEQQMTEMAVPAAIVARPHAGGHVERGVRQPPDRHRRSGDHRRPRPRRVEHQDDDRHRAAAARRRRPAGARRPGVEVPARRARRRPHHRGAAPRDAQRTAELHDAGVVQPGPRRRAGRAWDPEELVAIGLAEPASFEPGTGWEYSNTNTVLAGLIVEQLTGQPLRVVLRDRIFAPLGMGTRCSRRSTTPRSRTRTRTATCSAPTCRRSHPAARSSPTTSRRRPGTAPSVPVTRPTSTPRGVGRPAPRSPPSATSRPTSKRSSAAGC